MDESGQLLDFLCRTCMQELVEITLETASNKPEQQWQYMFDESEEVGSMRIAELLSNAVPQIEVRLNDELPKKICFNCVKQLQCIYRFQEMCVQSQQQMLQFIARTNCVKKITEAKGHQIGTVNCISKEPHSEEDKDQNIEFASVDSSPVVTRSSGVHDPLEVINKIKSENIENLEPDAGVRVINEPCNDVQPDYKYINNLPALSWFAPKTAVLPVEIGAEQVRLPTPDNSCFQCNKSFKYPCLLQNHLKSHEKEKFEYRRYECNLCDRFFFKPESLHQHNLEHNSEAGIRTYSCNVCNKTLSSEPSLRKHKRNQHSDKKIIKIKKYSCEFCDKAFVAPTALRTHVRSHTGERPYLCPECGKSFSTPGCLKQHRFRHDNLKRYECPHCPLKFSASSDLGKHKLTHPENKRHVCDICGELFSTFNVLKKHKRYHSGTKPYKCDYCDKRFVVGDACRRHMRTHTGEKPYQCKYCDRAFAQSGDHMKHLRLHIGDNIYRCELCPSAFRLLSEKRLHFTTHKNDNEKTRERNMEELKREEAKLELKASLTKKTKDAGGSVTAES